MLQGLVLIMVVLCQWCTSLWCAYTGQGIRTDYLWFDKIHLHKPPKREQVGNQILHFRIENKDIEVCDPSGKTELYIESNLKDCTVLYSDADVLKYAVEEASKNDGYFLEFGVALGKSTNFIAALVPFRTLHGFDSFCGLPKTTTSVWPQGECAYIDATVYPPLLANVQLHVGFFDDVLPLFKKNTLKDSSIAFMNVDCDLYESTQSVFRHLGDNIRSGTVIVFDEYFGYATWPRHEFKAFQEFLLERQLKYEYLAYNKWHEQVVVRIL